MISCICCCICCICIWACCAAIGLTCTSCCACCWVCCICCCICVTSGSCWAISRALKSTCWNMCPWIIAAACCCPGGTFWINGDLNSAKCDLMCASWSWSANACAGCICKNPAFSIAGDIGCGCGGGGNTCSICCMPMASYMRRYASYMPCGPWICGLDCTICIISWASITRWLMEKIFGSDTGMMSIRSSKSCANNCCWPLAIWYGYALIGDSLITRASRLNSTFWL